ncbi:thiamine pyrophosphate-requiring protein [Stackebrandtia nassauensis]|uniref:Thiamine pyrophosphate protein TPP binding domain protein n=1 Tax=Stackebrandtia nassauensis (strain DSM 44728 / CIP 108903 / NRRL B-16338 / NBRC 102104 / LLR-40K-21) TaxID=446470 RepID=D3Q898_STANL|nr:thiamine pyrophosphate-requiring protein [Stackebrandtia nassauensis]ADD42472.1 thiamine pyrophosphate protein TPP binding domain protein [Stackebrandtia nassauensis DSM 44728]
MTFTVADHILARLREWEVDTVFGYPGEGINGLLAAWQRDTKNAPRFVQARHEEMAAFAAVGYAKFSGRVGVCASTSGPGAIHLLNGLYDAKMDHVPVVAIIGQTERGAMGGTYQQEIDLPNLFKDVAGAYVHTVTVPEQLPNVLDRAIRTAVTRCAPTAVIIPQDVQELRFPGPNETFRPSPSSVGIERPVAVPDTDALGRAAEVLNAGHKVAILVGQGARDAAPEVAQVAELTGAGVAKALLGKDVLPDTLPFVTGATGLLGTRPSYEMIRDCDTLLAVGTSFPYAKFLPGIEQARGVQIDIDGGMIGMRYPFEVNLVGDAKATLRLLIPLLENNRNRSWRDKIEANVAQWWNVIEQQSTVSAKPTNPMRTFVEASKRLPDDAIVTCDSGSAATWYARHLKFGEHTRGSLSGTLASMGCGVPYGIGAKAAFPERPVWCFVGDGAMQMNGLAELLTVGRYWREWDNPHFVVVVLNNGELNQVSWEMRAMAGSPMFPESQTLPQLNYARFAHDIGMVGLEVGSPEDIPGAWDAAVAAEQPVVMDVHCDPNVPPIPPAASFEQIKSTTAALLKGDDNAWEVLKEGVMTKMKEMATRRRD